ncbi:MULTISPECIES: DUF2911 domain-containing protein [unclassified Imperialibacter]|uniref:DUF2911 domain-containing protein n=1 Tax=unclassified Imperialibacter TaxID=2629706 RepID=UPI00125C1BFB|nr:MULTISPECIES: DUF2911 domain-containing protein [unclassified Imperialibacter]CAD5264668.1 conserved hypothetical protein [Imperialibacter sp. 89]CAD5269560.1 conserved hypothetical protein [Imperialibacter sp. 75]VVT09180.1 conserved hypothetical protein [Imperialibacter sp. EC-SDR9]
MKNLSYLLLALVLLTAACESKKSSTDEHQHHATEPVVASVDTLKKSIPKEAHGQVGGVHVSMSYHAPGARGRVIWGGLVPFNEVWVTGAHSATSVTFSKAVKIGGEIVPEGKYALFTIPGKDSWQIIINRNWEQHLADDYSAAEDVVRVEVVPQTDLPLQERLNYNIEDKGDGKGAITMTWEKLGVTLEFSDK